MLCLFDRQSVFSLITFETSSTFSWNSVEGSCRWRWSGIHNFNPVALLIPKLRRSNFWGGCKIYTSVPEIFYYHRNLKDEKFLVRSFLGKKANVEDGW